jgi:hypothetical protein
MAEDEGLEPPSPKGGGLYNRIANKKTHLFNLYLFLIFYQPLNHY